MTKKYLFFDTETHNAGKEYGMKPEEFVRIFQYAWNDGPVRIITDHEQMLNLLREADFIVGHNIISSDMHWVFGVDSLEPLKLAMQRKVIDTFYLANLLTPSPYAFRRESGQVSTAANKPVEHTMGWLGLANLCYQFKLSGKLGDLKTLAKKYNPPKTKIADLDYSLIPLDDPDFIAYAEQDVVAVRELWYYLQNQIKEQGYPGDYIWREMELMSATVGQMSRNGILVNQEYGQSRIQEQEKQKEETLKILVEKYGFPTTGKAPWSSAAGKEATIKALSAFGFTPVGTSTWEKTPTGAPKLGGEDLLVFTEGTPAEDFVRNLAALKGNRPIAQLVMDNVKEDGRVHPKVTSLQRSGRWSFTNPGVTVFGERNERLRADKALFMAAPGNVLAGFDYSSADARAMAGLAGDHAFARRFEVDENGKDLYDGHNLTGEAIFGKEPYYLELDAISGKPSLRPVAKAAGHAQNYNIGAYRLANTLNLEATKLGMDLFFWASAGKNKDGTLRSRPIEIPEKFRKYFKNHEYVGSLQNPPKGLILTKQMIENFNSTFSFLKAFKDQAVQEGEQGYVTNSWGRRMAVDEGRAYTMGPALHGQSVTREMMGDAILRLIRKGDYYIRALRAIIHDELLLEFSDNTIERDIQVTKECMEHEFKPHTRVGFPINFPVGHGYGKTWKEAGH